MSFESSNDDAWLERQMREVPLPPGLIAPLKEIAAGDDQMFDEALRDVPVPSHLVAALHAIPTDRVIAKRLRQVEVPAGLTKSLRSIPAAVALDAKLAEVEVPASLAENLRGIAAYTDDEIDRQLNDVPVPFDLMSQLRDLARSDQLVSTSRRASLVQWAVAASLLLMVSSLFYGSMAGMMLLAFRAQQPAADPELQAELPLQLVLSEPDATIELPALEREVFQVASAPVESVAIDSVELIADDRPQRASEIQNILDTFSPSRRGYDPLFNVFLATHVISASPTVDMPMPEVAVLEHHRPGGILPPTVKQYDLLQLIRTGTHPFVSPGSNSVLETSQAPLSTDTWSYDHLWRQLRDGQLPAPREVFPQEFLAAINYEFPPADEPGLAIRTAAGPSPFGEPGTHLLQVGVVTNDDSNTVRQVRYLTFAIDNSFSVARHGRLEAVQQALVSMIGRLGPRDRFSLVTFGGGSQVLLENASRDDLHQASSIIQAIRPRQRSDFAAGLQLACDEALGVQLDSRIQRSVVLLTDSADKLNGQVFEQLLGVTAAVRDLGVGLEVVDLSGREGPNPRLSRFAAMGDGSVQRATDATTLRSALQRVLTGSDPVVARDARLSVHFDPRAVEAYRLIGHEADSVGGWIAGAPIVDLRSGETATALYEVRLSDSKLTEIATVKVSWFDPISKQPRTRTQPVGRVQFTASLLESPLSLQRGLGGPIR